MFKSQTNKDANLCVLFMNKTTQSLKLASLQMFLTTMPKQSIGLTSKKTGSRRLTTSNAIRRLN